MLRRRPLFTPERKSRPEFKVELGMMWRLKEFGVGWGKFPQAMEAIFQHSCTTSWTLRHLHENFLHLFKVMNSAHSRNHSLQNCNTSATYDSQTAYPVT
jgi:hypothetical protein